MDATRYLIGHIRKPKNAHFEIGLPPPGQGSLFANAPPEVFNIGGRRPRPRRGDTPEQRRENRPRWGFSDGPPTDY